MAFPFRVANCKTFRIRDKISETVLEESPFSFNPPETRKKLHCVSINSCVISRNCLLPNTGSIYELRRFLYLLLVDCNGVQREHNKKLNNGLPILHKVPPKRDYGRYFCIMAEKGGTSHGGLTEKLSPFFHAKKQEVNAYGR